MIGTGQHLMKREHATTIYTVSTGLSSTTVWALALQLRTAVRGPERMPAATPDAITIILQYIICSLYFTLPFV